MSIFEKLFSKKHKKATKAVEKSADISFDDEKSNIMLSVVLFEEIRDEISRCIILQFNIFEDSFELIEEKKTSSNSSIERNVTRMDKNYFRNNSLESFTDYLEQAYSLSLISLPKKEMLYLFDGLVFCNNEEIDGSKGEKSIVLLLKDGVSDDIIHIVSYKIYIDDYMQRKISLVDTKENTVFLFKKASNLSEYEYIKACLYEKIHIVNMGNCAAEGEYLSWKNSDSRIFPFYLWEKSTDIYHIDVEISTAVIKSLFGYDNALYEACIELFSKEICDERINGFNFLWEKVFDEFYKGSKIKRGEFLIPFRSVFNFNMGKILKDQAEKLIINSKVCNATAEIVFRSCQKIIGLNWHGYVNFDFLTVLSLLLFKQKNPQITLIKANIYFTEGIPLDNIVLAFDLESTENQRDIYGFINGR